MSSEQTRVSRICRQCGAAFEGGPQRRICDGCRRANKNALGRKGYRKKYAPAEPVRVVNGVRMCVKCGEPIGKDNRFRFCQKCRRPEHEESGGQGPCLPMKRTVKVRFKKPLLRVIRLELPRSGHASEAQILAWARLYHAPFSSYGKMKAWIEEMKHLPPADYLRVVART